VTSDVWAATHTARQHPQDVSVVHLGDHVFKDVDGEFQLLQLTPARLSGRDFSNRPPEETTKVSPSYYDSPEANGNEVTVVFVVTAQLSDLMLLASDLSSECMAVMRSTVRSLLADAHGYLCQEDGGTFVLAFSRLEGAAEFGTKIHAALVAAPWPMALADEAKFRGRIQARVGIYAGVPLERRPHATSGRADYFGTVLNRAARVAYTADMGQTLVPSDTAQRLPLGHFAGHFVGSHKFKGVEEKVDLDELREG
jgi:exonuclease 3'-5' domain-containing protein 2